MDLVVCNMSNALDWESGIVNRNFFVVRELLRSGLFKKALLVDFLAVNPVGLRFGKRRTLKYAYKVLAKQGRASVVRRLGPFHVLRSFPAPSWGVKTETYILSGVGTRLRYEHDVKRVEEAMGVLGFDPKQTIFWSYQAFAPELLRTPAMVRVFDAVDDWSQHASYGEFRERLQQNYKAIGRNADLVFTVSDGLLPLFPNGKAKWVPNGVDLDVFAAASASPLMPPDMTALPKPVIGYVGTVQERIDFDLLEQVCKRWPQASFVFVGPVWSGVQQRVNRFRQACPQAVFLGRRPYQSVPAYLQAMDVAIIPHRLDEFIRSTNPMKLYDYLAAGKPVVSTPGAGTELFAAIVHLASSPQEFADAIGQALQENGYHQAARFREAVRPYTWQARMAKMREALQHVIKKAL